MTKIQEVITLLMTMQEIEENKNRSSNERTIQHSYKHNK
jgi:hypothetical protein